VLLERLPHEPAAAPGAGDLIDPGDEVVLQFIPSLHPCRPQRADNVPS
jgi:hypothetical protein